MQAREVFGIIVRVLGVICLIRFVLDASLAICMATAVPSVGTLPVSMAASRGISYLLVGLLLVFGTKFIVRVAYEKTNL
jgi:hypothetical protein